MPRKLDKPSWESIRKARRWSETEGRWVLAELQRSGSSAKAFAESHQISVTRVYYWCARFPGDGRTRRTRMESVPRLVEVKFPAAGSRALAADRIDIELHGGRRLSVPEGMSLERLSALVTLLERG